MIAPAFATRADFTMLQLVLFDILATLVIGASIIFHELGHAFAGRWFAGCKKSSITLFALGALCSNAMTEYTSEMRRIVIFAAGPFANFLLALLSFGVIYVFNSYMFVGHHYSFLGAVMVMTLSVNMMLGIFNMLPIFPLDGGQILFHILMLTRLTLKQCKYTTFAIAVVTALVAILYFKLFTLLGLITMGIILYSAWQNLIAEQETF
jgi:stage IV sporulation protein FB